MPNSLATCLVIGVNSSGMTYEPSSMVGHGTGLFTGNRALRYLSFAAFTDGASQNHTASCDSPITHRPALVLETRIKENPDVVCVSSQEVRVIQVPCFIA